MAVQVLVAMLSAWFVYVIWYICNLLRLNRGHTLTLVILMSNQEGAAEGFLRRLLSRYDSLWPGLQLVIVDDGSVDDTAGIIRLLGRKFHGADIYFSAEVECRPVMPGVAFIGDKLVWCYDTRGQRDKELLNSPLFSLLSLS